MPRILNDQLSILKLQDNLSNTLFELTYRPPTAAERAAFSNEAIQRKRNKLIFRTAETRLKYGLEILEGIREGDFIVKQGGKLIPLSSDKQSGHYDADWKQKLAAHASDIVMLLAAHVFEAPAEILDEDEPSGENAEKN